MMQESTESLRTRVEGVARLSFTRLSQHVGCLVVEIKSSMCMNQTIIVPKLNSHQVRFVL